MAVPCTETYQTALPESATLRLVSRGKVRDLYEVADGADAYLLFVATDRISAFDVVLNNGVPGKGALLTQLSAFWFERLAPLIGHHVVATSLDALPPGVRAQVAPHWAGVLAGRTLLVRKARVVKLEAIVRGYLTGSAWSEYVAAGTVHGIPLPDGYAESAALAAPLFTPSTKAAAGAHDENISPARAKELIGEELYDHVARAAVALYKEAAAYALSRGLILADTKFEFGLVPASSLPSSLPSLSPIISIDGAPHALILVDEALTPDSSRYWAAAAYAPGRAQTSFDKQFLRDWLSAAGFRRGLEGGPPGHEGAGWSMTPEVVAGTRERYEEVVRLLTG
ncbi:SAICAR synthetase [Phellopilus nigrolimitatus]|nr:SAICAR synthetase [Phellopilus nigrolimitatus]